MINSHRSNKNDHKHKSSNGLRRKMILSTKNTPKGSGNELINFHSFKQEKSIITITGEGKINRNIYR
jgi:hypothetical protein